MSSVPEALAFISNMVSGLSTRSIEESTREAVLIGSVSNHSTLISMARLTDGVISNLCIRAVSSVTMGFVIRLNKLNYAIMAYNKLIKKTTSKGGSLCVTCYSNAKSF